MQYMLLIYDNEADMKGAPAGRPRDDDAGLPRVHAEHRQVRAT